MNRASLLRGAGSVILVLVLIVLAYILRGNRQHARFTAELAELQQSGPAIILREDAMADAEVAGKVAAIAEIYNTHNDGWCNGDGNTYASVFTQDADFIAFDGTHTKGRESIAASHQELFDRFLSHTCLEGRITSIRFLGANAAVVHVVSGTRFGANTLVRRPSIQTYVAVEQSGMWRFASFHNGRIDPVQDRNVLRLAWLGLETFVFRR